MVYFLCFGALVAGAAAWTDFRSGLIPNWLTFGTIGLAMAAHLVVGWRFAGGWSGAVSEVGRSLGGLVLCSVVPAFMYWKGAIGGGDVKLFAALGALSQPMAGLEVETYAFIAAALIAPAKLAYDGVLLKTLGRSLSLIVNPFRKRELRREVPAEAMTWFRLGPAIFIGAAATALTRWGSL